MFCRSYSCKLQQPAKSEKKLRKPKDKPSKEVRITLYPQEDSIYVTRWYRPPIYKMYYLDSAVPYSVASHPEFISWREKALLARELKEKASESIEKPEYTKKDLNKQSKYRRVSSVYSSSLRPKSAKEAIYESLFSEF